MSKRFTHKLSFFLFFAWCSFSLYAQNTWLQKANYGGGKREAATGFAIGDTGYIMTGVCSDSNCTNVWAWNPVSNTWVMKDTVAIGKRIGASAVSLFGYGYMIGGMKPSTCFTMQGGVCAGTFLKDFWRYNPATDTWTALPSFPGTARNYAVAVADPLDSTIYYGTGNNNDTILLFDWWAYNINTTLWTQLSNFAGGQRSNAIGFFVNGNVYAGAGDNNDKKIDATSDIWRFNTDSNSWTKVANIPSNARRSATTFVIDNKAYVGLGVQSNSTTMNDLWMYDAVKDTWSVRASYPPGGGYLSVGFTIGNKGYFGTGTIATKDSFLLYEYTPYAQDTITGIPIVKPDNADVHVYPNPSNGTLNLSYNGLDGNSVLTITDMLGNVVETRKIDNKRGTVSLEENNLSNGIYFYRLSSPGKPPSAGKIVIVR